MYSMMARQIHDNQYLVFGCKSGKNGWHCPHNKQLYMMFKEKSPASLSESVNNLKQFEKIDDKTLSDVISSIKNADVKQKFESAKAHLVEEGLVQKKI